MNREAVARELLKVAKELIAETPLGREGGLVKSVMKRIAKKYGWSTSRVFLERDYSGYTIYGDKDVEDLPTMDMSGGRTRDDLNKDLQKEADKMKRDLEAKLRKFDPEKVVVSARVSLGGREGGHARLMIYVKFEEGVPVTPIQFL